MGWGGGGGGIPRKERPKGGRLRKKAEMKGLGKGGLNESHTKFK
jgi:hypothetical protein